MVFAYKKRIADSILADKLSYMGAVLVRGPKWCGKTTTCEQIAKSAIYMDDPELMVHNRDYAAINVKDLLRSAEKFGIILTEMASNAMQSFQMKTAIMAWWKSSLEARP